MDILTPIETKELLPSYINLFKDTAFYEALLKVQVDGSLVISYKEWPLKELPNTAKVNHALHKMGNNMMFKVRTIQSGKQFVFIRTK